ncbi:hypothetical protein GF340_03745 [Candidatus Peregrinibacteria bacterium]|nr:hypothetical protein [Candidatus Peregrinibacteria bacterium]
MKSLIASSVKKIELALENPNLSEEARKELTMQLNLLGKKEQVLALGSNAATDLLKGGDEKQREFLRTEFSINNRQEFLQRQLEEYIMPGLAGLQYSAETLKKEKIQFATKESDIEAYYNELFMKMDMTDQHLDSTILENDLTNESLLSSLKEQKKALDQIDIQPPNGLYGAYQSSFGVMFGTIGGGLNWVAENMIDQSTWLADVSQSNYEERTKTFWGNLGYYGGRVGSTIVEIFPTVTGAAAGLVGGVFTMAGEPAEAWKGVKMLFGPNYKEAWSEMGKALIAYDDFEKGRYGVGIGKFFVNVGTVLIPAAGPIGTGAKAARASMAGANKVTASAILRAGGVGLKEAGVAAAAGIRTTALSGYRSIGDFAHALKMNPLQFIKGGFVISGRSFKSVFYESIAGKMRTPEQILQKIIKGVREKHPNITDAELTVYLRERYPQFFAAEREWLAVRQMADEIKALNEESVAQRVYSLLRDQYARQHPNMTRDELLNLLKNDKPDLYAKYERLNHLDSQMAPILMAENRANGLLRSAMRDPDKMNMLLEKLGNGEMHLTTDIVNYFLTDSNNAAKLKTVLGKPDLKLSSTVNYERLVQEIRLLKYRELKAVSSPRQMTDDITQILVKIRRGQKIDINDDLGQVFLRLKEKNPEFFKKLIDAPLEEMAQTETIEGILRNNKYIDQNVNGLEVVGFFGKELGAGGMGAVNEFAYYVGKNGRIKFGAIKKAHASSGVISDTFAEEIANVPNVRRLKTKHILKPLDNGETFIIFESGTNKYSMYTCENHLTPAEALKAHQQMMGVTKEYFRNGFFHGDEKWDQWVRLSKEGQPVDTYHVDNSPIPFKVAGEFGETWAATPQYSISYHSIPQYKTRLANSGIIDPVTQAEYIGRTADAYSHLIVAEELLAKYSGRLPAHAVQEMQNLKSLTDLTIPTRTHRIAIQNWNQLHWIREDWTKLDVVRLGDPKFMDELIAAEEALIRALNRPTP